MDNYKIKAALTIVALIFSIVPLLHSAWHYQRAKRITNLPPEFKQRRIDAAFEWKGWKISLTSLSLVLNCLINLIP
jgi:hypothetical protein